MAAPKNRSRTYPRPFEVTLGPWQGVDDSPTMQTGRDGREWLQDAVNVARSSDGMLTAVKPITSGGGPNPVTAGNQVRGIIEDAAGLLFAVYRDQLWRRDTLGAWSNVAPAGLATWLGTGTSPVHMLAFAGQLVLARDGQIPQRITNLSAGTVTATAIALNVGGTETTTGMPTIYSGRVFFPITSDRSTFVWSEPGDPSLGYQQSGYANVWRFAQTSDAPLRGLWGTNSRLLVVRDGSIAAVYGQAAADFATVATSDNVAVGIGRCEMTTFVQVNDETWFVDGAGGIRFIPASGAVSDIVGGMSLLRTWHLPSNRAGVRWGAAYAADEQMVRFVYPINTAEYVAARQSLNVVDDSGNLGTAICVQVHVPTRTYWGMWYNAYIAEAGGTITGTIASSVRGIHLFWHSTVSTGVAWFRRYWDEPQGATGDSTNTAAVSTRRIAAPPGSSLTLDLFGLTVATYDTATVTTSATVLGSAQDSGTGTLTFTSQSPLTPAMRHAGLNVHGRWAQVYDLDLPTTASSVGPITLSGFVDAPDPNAA